MMGFGLKVTAKQIEVTPGPADYQLTKDILRQTFSIPFKQGGPKVKLLNAKEELQIKALWQGQQ